MCDTLGGEARCRPYIFQCIFCDRETAPVESMAGGNSRRSTDAQALFDSITRGQFVVALAILSSVMTVTKPLSKILQSSTDDLMIALTMVKTVVDH